LKKSTLVSLKEIVTLTFLPGKTSLPGGGRKSLILVTFPMGISRSFRFFIVILASSSPKSSADNSDHIFAIGKSYSQDFIANFTYTKIPILFPAMTFINDYLSVLIFENCCGVNERNPMLLHIGGFFS
jgi:hypothetical protein